MPLTEGCKETGFLSLQSSMEYPDSASEGETRRPEAYSGLRNVHDAEEQPEERCRTPAPVEQPLNSSLLSDGSFSSSIKVMSDGREAKPGFGLFTISMYFCFLRFMILEIKCIFFCCYEEVQSGTIESGRYFTLTLA